MTRIVCAALLALTSLACTTASRGEGRASSSRDSSQVATAEYQELASLNALLEDARKAEEEKDHAGARERIVQGIARALEELSTKEDAPTLELLEQMGRFAYDSGEVPSSKQAAERVLEVRSRTLPDEHPDLQRARLDLARALSSLGDLQGARALEEKALEISLRTLPEDHPDLQRARGNLAATLKTLGDLEGARELLEKVVEVRTRTLPDDHPQLQLARGNLAATLDGLGDLEGARELFEKVVEVSTRTLPPDHPDLQWARLNLASTLSALGDLERARELQASVLEVYARTLPAEHPDVQWAQSNQASTLSSLGDLAGARVLQEKVLEVWSRTLPDDHAYLQIARMNLASTRSSLGDLAEARELFEKVLAVSSRTLPEDHPDLQRVRLNLSDTIRLLGDFAGARALQEKVLEVFTRTLPDDHPELQWARGNLAGTIARLGDLAGARRLKEKVLEVSSRTLPEDHPDLQNARLSLATTIAQLGDLEGARKLQEKVLEVCSRTLAEDHPDYQLARGNLAATMRAQGDLRGARELFEEVLGIYARTLPEDHPNLQWARSNVASAMYGLGDFAGAREHFETVLEVRARALPEDHPDLQLARGDLAWTLAHELARQGRASEEAKGERVKVEDRCVELIEVLCRAQTRAARAALLESATREAEARCAQLSESLSTSISFAGGLGVFDPVPELQRASFLLGETTRGAALTSARLLRRASGSPGWAELRARLRQCNDELASLVRKGTTSESFHDALTRREETERALVALARDAAGGTVAGLDFEVEALAQALGREDAVVAFRRYARTFIEPSATTETSVDSLCAFVVRHDGTAALTCVDLGPIDPIEQAVQGWRDGTGVVAGRGLGIASRPAADLAERGDALRRLVLDPLAPGLDGARRLVLVLDDVLHLVPFDALPSDRKTGELVGDHLRIETRATVTELLEVPSRPAEPGGLVAVGDVAFDESRAGDRELHGVLRGGAFSGFAPLSATGPEVEALAESFAELEGSRARVSILRGPDATRQRLIELAPGASWLHVATHGWFASESIRSWQDEEPLDKLSGLGRRLSGEEQVKGMSPMLLCGLALAGANLPEDDLGRGPGLVTADEISALDLTRCELAVLSACDTNVGERRAGQGVHSLQMALQMAGARSVITSLWKVPDEATRELMTDFYRRLWVEKKPKWQALWEAKRRLRDAKDERGAPKYSTRDWAAWVLTGAPE